jgi:hypothetical protein
MTETERRERLAHWHGLPALFWLSSYVASHHLDVAPQLGAKINFIESFTT